MTTFPSKVNEPRFPLAGLGALEGAGPRRNLHELCPDRSTNDNKPMAAFVDGGGTTFQAGADVSLFDDRFPKGDYPYDVSADGQRFVMNTRLEQSTSTPLTVVVNWMTNLKR